MRSFSLSKIRGHAAPATTASSFSNISRLSFGSFGSLSLKKFQLHFHNLLMCVFLGSKEPASESGWLRPLIFVFTDARKYPSPKISHIPFSLHRPIRTWFLCIFEGLYFYIFKKVIKKIGVVTFAAGRLRPKLLWLNICGRALAAGTFAVGHSRPDICGRDTCG